MRLNVFIAQSTTLSRRKADEAIAAGRVTINGQTATPGQQVSESDRVALDERALTLRAMGTTIQINKPVGYVCSRNGQGSRTVYDLLPAGMRQLKPVGRLDKDSSGLLLMTDDGQLAHRLTHPRYQKQKVYQLRLDKPLLIGDQRQIASGIKLEDGKSRLALEGEGTEWTVTMSEGRNRQIRRTFAALGYLVTALHRNQFGPYRLGNLGAGSFISVKALD